MAAKSQKDTNLRSDSRQLASYSLPMAKETQKPSDAEVSWQQLVSDYARLNGPTPARKYATKPAPPTLTLGRVTLGAKFMARLMAATGVQILTEEEIAEVRAIDAKAQEINLAREFWCKARDGHSVSSMLEAQLAERVARDGVAGLATTTLPSRQEFSEAARSRIRVLNEAEKVVQAPLKPLARRVAERIEKAARTVLERVEAQEREEAAEWGVPYQPGSLVETLRFAAAIPAGFVPAAGPLTLSARSIGLLAWVLAEGGEE